ncbi:MAG: hypothetical protein HYV07_20255 [Deltaproteobacteria bacterium]|nr:hypothetical protein [Deltaproteobacteria bacterium]
MPAPTALDEMDDGPELDDAEVSALEEVLEEIEREDRQARVDAVLPRHDELALLSTEKDVQRRSAERFVGSELEKSAQFKVTGARGVIRTDDLALKGLLTSSLSRSSGSLERRRTEPKKRSQR